MSKKNLATYLPDPDNCPGVRFVRNNPKADQADSWVITEDIMNAKKEKSPKPEKVFDENDAIIEQLIQEKNLKKTGKKKEIPELKEIKEKPKTRKKNKRLTEDDIRSIRENAKNGIKNSIQADEYGVTQPCIWNIVQRNTWKHIK